MGFCYKTAAIWQVIGYVFWVLKILIPVVLIILGVVNLAQAVISNDEKAISKTAMSLIKKIAIGMVIFFIPLIVTSIFNLLGLFIDYKDDFKNCLGCVTAPRTNCDTSYQGDVIPMD